MTDLPPTVVNVHEVPEMGETEGAWGGPYRPLTPGMAPRGGRLGMNQTRLPKGHVACPFHHHLREDEAFFVLSGRGVLRYGDTLWELRPGDCVSCPAGTGVAHQIANPYDEDLVYLGIGLNDPHEVCVYPDSGKIMVRAYHQVGFLRTTPYMEGELAAPQIFALIDARGRSQ